MLLVMNAQQNQKDLSVEELKTKLFKTSRPKSAIIINEACEKAFFYLEASVTDKRKGAFGTRMKFTLLISIKSKGFQY